jgi:Response regulator containing a CheY-like receiver domain and an HTH DNA-binding domain
MHLPRGGQGLHDESLLRFVTTIHESLEVERLGASYMAGIPQLVSANAYGLYVLNRADGRPSRIAVQGGVDRFIDRYEEVGYACDPLMDHMFRTKEPVHEGVLFSDSEWQRHPLRQALTMHNLVRILEAPLVVNGRALGTLYFSRRSDDPPFTESDLGVLGLIARHVGPAMDHALKYVEAQERCRMAEGALQLIDMALILSDDEGTVKFANESAQLLMGTAESAVRDGGFFDDLRDNLSRLAPENGDPAVGSVKSGSGTVTQGTNIALRSMRIPGLSHTVATFLYLQDEAGGSDFQHLRAVLPEREIEVLGLIAKGLQNKQIAKRLFVSTNTVKYHLKRMYQTMDVNSRSELLSKAYAAQYGGNPQG